MDQNDDLELLQKISEGNTQAFDALFERYWQQGYTDAYRRLNDREEAKDVVQEIFTHIWANRETLQIQNFPGYLHVAIRNKVIKVIARKKTTHPFFDFLDEAAVATSRADSNLLWKEFLKAYEILIESLPPKRQEIFRMRYHEDLSTKVIAEKMGISRKTVQNQLGKAIDTLKVALLHLFSAIAVILNCL